MLFSVIILVIKLELILSNGLIQSIKIIHINDSIKRNVFEL
jgi:hypothetical protein